MWQETGSKSHECVVEYNETEVSTVKLTYTDDQGTSYFVTGTLNTTLGSESFSWGGIWAGTDIGGGSGGAGGSTEVTDLQRLTNYFAPGTRTWDDVMPDDTWLPMTGENMADESLIHLVYDGDDYIIIEYNSSYYKVSINESGVFTAVDPYTSTKILRYSSFMKAISVVNLSTGQEEAITEPYDIKLSIEGVEGDIVLNNSNSSISEGRVYLQDNISETYKNKKATITMNLNGEILTCEGNINVGK